jgi:hypothetical protein
MSLTGVPWFLDYSPAESRAIPGGPLLPHILPRLYTFATLYILQGIG